nr:DUF268 domain-containing protein [uncultured Acetatifactor sp.]
MKEKILVWGLGNEFKKNQAFIESYYEVIGYVDSKIQKSQIIDGKYFYSVEDIKKSNYEKILICSMKWKDSIKIQICELGISMKSVLVYGEKHQELSDEDRSLNKVIEDMRLYNRMNHEHRFLIERNSIEIFPSDKNDSAGQPETHYFAQDIWGARKVYENRPTEHFDIGSRLDGFIAHLLVFREVYYIDVRPLPFKIPNLKFVQGDATELTQIEDGSIESLSSFHALEHFGLGRYGDKVDPSAYKKAAKSMVRVLKKEGILYLGVPIGPEDKLIFHAHRIFKIQTILDLFGDLKLSDLAVITPKGVSVEKIEKKNYENIQEYSCGLFEFIKL